MPNFSLDPATKNALFLVAFLVLALCPLSFISITTNDVPQDDARQNMLAAYAYYNGEAVKNSREPLYPALLSATLRLADAKILQQCFREKVKCADVFAQIKKLNWVFHALSTMLVGLAVLYITGRPGLTLLAMAGISLNTVMISAVNNWLTEPQAVFFLLAHSAMLYGIAVETNRKTCAVLSGLALGCLILTKSVFVYLLFIYVIVGLAVTIPTRLKGKEHSRKYKPFLLLCLTALLFILPFQKDEKPADTLDYNRGAAVMAIRAEYDTMPWGDVLPALLYFTPEIGPDLVKKYYGDDIHGRFDRENKTGYYGRVKNRNGVAYDLAKKEKMSLQAAALKIIQQNMIKHIVLTPVFAYEGLFIPKKIAADNTKFAPAKILSKIVNILLLPLFLIAALWLLRRKYYVYLLLAAPAIYSFAIHSVLTHYWPRYSVPLLAIGLVFAAVAWHLRRQEKFS